ncbi:putative globin [gamma proteobacterium HdN1]|nr:putative globin [gamma proteobacterium HdN1]
MDTTPYELLGGEAGLRKLTHTFYDVMDRLPEAKEVRDMHDGNLDSIKERLFEYLSGWLGGPQLFRERHGSVCITSQHKKFSIGPAERDQWLMCMDVALDEVGASAETKAMLKEPIYRLADFLRSDKQRA